MTLYHNSVPNLQAVRPRLPNEVSGWVYGDAAQFGRNPLKFVLLKVNVEWGRP